jgi:hypothetical protein
MRTHIGVFLLIGCLSIIYTWPVFSHPTQTIPGIPGDNILFYWDLWRAQQAIANCENPLYTHCIFYPQGQSLVFHTNSVLHAILTYPLRQRLSLAGMYNLWVFGSFVVGGWGAFLLGRYLLANDWAALLVAFVFSFSPFRISHLGNHMMLFSMHWMPFYVLFLLKLRDGKWWHGALAGCFLACTAWTDLHQAIHLLVFTAFTAVWWLRFARSEGIDHSLRPILTRFMVSATVTALLTMPILIPSAHEVLQRADGDTGKMPNATDIRMRSSRPINFLLPPARHPLWGWLGQESTELQLTVGFGVIALCYVAWRCRRDEARAVSYWVTASVWIVALTMGPILMLNSKYTVRIDGAEYNLPMPHALLDLVPGINMARAPARFMGLGTLAIGVVAGYGMRHLLGTGRWKWGMAAAIAVAIEFAGKPFPVLQIYTPPALAELAKQDGAVIDLPFGAGSALRQSGHMDYYSILYQTAHGRPRVGGMVSRCSDHYRQRLLDEPLLGSLLRIYDGKEIDDCQHERDRNQAEETMHRYGIRHALLRPNQQGKTAYWYLRDLFPDAIEHAIDDSLWIELLPKKANDESTGKW